MSLLNSMEAARSSLIEESRFDGGVDLHCSRIMASVMRQTEKLREEAKDYRTDVVRILSGSTQENPVKLIDMANNLELRYPRDQGSDTTNAFYRHQFAYYAAMGLVVDEIAGMVSENPGFSYFLK